MSETLKILVVDDMKSIVPEVNTALSKLNISCDIDLRCPEDPTIRFGCQLPAGRELDKYDLALVDLELFPTNASIYYEPDDLRGGTEVLPYLREEAPWLPVIAESRLYLKEAEHFLAVAGSFGFDGHLPRDVFRKGIIDKPLWEMLMKTASDLRKKAVIGDKNWRERHTPDLEVTSEAQATLGRASDSWRQLLQEVFCFSRKVIVSQLRGGFSGAYVFKAYVRPPFEHGGAEGQWLLKVSNSPWKLHQEAQAHRTMLHGGLDFARMVPLLWSEVIVAGRGAAIAYQFATDTKEASEMLDEPKNLERVCEGLRKILQRFYRDTRRERSIIKTLCEEWGPTQETIAKVWPLVPKSKVKNFLKDYASAQVSPLLAENVEYKRCLIHGDLHLSNIMIGSVDVLIDFARSSDGPISVDAAKLISDFLLRLPNTRDSELAEWDSNNGLMGEILATLRDAFNFDDGDKKLFSLFLILDLAVALHYNDVDKETKAWIRTVFSKVTI